VPRPGRYTEILNSDSHFYGGSGVGNGGVDLIAEERPWMELPYSIVITVPPLGGLVLQPEPLPEPVLIAVAEEEEPADQDLLDAVVNDEEAEELAQPE
jgi:1,4-alpha-glucan branching enzyme